MNEDSLRKSEDDIEDNLSKCDENLLQTTEFAALCSFIHHFGTELGIYLTFPQLEQFLSLGNSANWKNWETLHIKLLNKLKYRARPEKWEPVLGRFLFNHAADIDGLPEAAECLVSGVCDKPSIPSQSVPVHVSRPYSPVYYGLDVEVRTRLLLALLESQFDRNQGFKEKVNLRSAVDLRFRPLGYDVWGRIYWLLKDSEVNVLLYREDSERRTFQLICRTTEEMRAVRSQLENACPTSMKLSDILKSRTDTAFDLDKTGPASPSLTTTLHQLVQDGVASTEAEQMHLDAETTLANGMECDTLNQTSDSAQSPNRMLQNGVDESNRSDDMLSEIKLEPQPEKSVENRNSPEPVPRKPESLPKTEMENVEAKLDSNKSSSLATTEELESGSCNKIDEDQNCVKLEVKSEGDQDKSMGNTGSHIAPSKPKHNKRGRGSKAARRKLDGFVDESTPALEVRRSGRVRKPVEFLTIEVPQPKRSRQSIKPTEPVTNGTDEQPKKKRRSEVVDESVKKKKKKRKQKRRQTKKSRSSNPWLNATSSSESDEDDTFERALREHDEMAYDSDIVDANRNEPDTLDWIDKPESDFNPDELDKESDVDSLTQGRNFARQKRLERMRVSRTTSVVTSNVCVDETCQVCGKAHEPEWILLCDQCDRGHHAMCLCPPLFVIPEGDWFCPRCQHATLLQTLADCADQIDNEQKKQTIWKRMQERLNFVNISMTNILADGDEEGEENGGRRRSRLAAQVVYQDSDLSQDDHDDDENDTEPDSDKSASPFLANGSESGSELFDGRRASSRRRTACDPRPKSDSVKRQGRRTTSRRRRNRWLSGSEDESTSASSDVSFAAPAPRAARQRPVQYDLGEAFKQLDEALEDDEKYQEEKRRRRSKKLNHEDEGCVPEDQNCSASPSSGPPPGRSRGKDLSNIMGPDWENQLELDRPGRSRKRRTGVLSSSSTDSNGSRSPISASKRKRKGSSDDTDDADFQPSGTSEDFSDQSDDDDGNEVESTSESDTSWLCAVRRRKYGAGTKTPRSSRPDRKRSTYSGRRRGRPIPRFEQSEDEVSLHEAGSAHESPSRVRPRRCARAVVSYRELDDQDENNSSSADDDSDAEMHVLRPTNRRRLASSTDEDASPGDRKSRANSAEALSLDRPPTPVSKRVKAKSTRATTRRRRVLSSSGSEYQPDRSEKDDDEEDGYQLEESAEVKPRITDPSIDRSVEVEETTSFESHRMDKSYVFDQPEDAPPAAQSESSSPTGLRITESSPEPPSPSVIPSKELLVPPKCVHSGHSQDEESVEEDAEDLLPRHPISSHLTSGEKSSNQTNKVPVSPDLFT